MTVAQGIGGKVTSCVPRQLELIHLSDFLGVQAELSKSDMNIAEEIIRQDKALATSFMKMI